MVGKVVVPAATASSSFLTEWTGLPLAAISVVDLALWDLVGKIRGESVSKMIGGHTKEEIPLYLTGPRPPVAKEKGFWGSKVPLPYSAYM